MVGGCVVFVLLFNDMPNYLAKEIGRNQLCQHNCQNLLIHLYHPVTQGHRGLFSVTASEIIQLKQKGIDYSNKIYIFWSSLAMIKQRVKCGRDFEVQ